MLKALVGAGVLTAALALPSVAETVRISRCYDGDTCTTTAGEKIRLACFDSPELRGSKANPIYARAARDFLRRLVVGYDVGIKRYGRDRYGRTVADLYVQDFPVGKVMVSFGHGVVMPRYAHQCSWAR